MKKVLAGLAIAILSISSAYAASSSVGNDQSKEDSYVSGQTKADAPVSEPDGKNAPLVNGANHENKFAPGQTKEDAPVSKEFSPETQSEAVGDGE